LHGLRRAFEPTEVKELTRRHGVVGTIVVQACDELDETRELLGLAAQSDLIWGVVGWLDLSQADVENQLESLLAAPGGARLAGLRPRLVGGDDPWSAPAARRGLAAIAAAGLIVDLLVDSSDLDHAVSFVSAYPELRFVIDHAGSPPSTGETAEWRRGLQGLAAHDNIAVKLSGLVNAGGTRRQPEDAVACGRTAAELFGEDRVFFGSDWPVCLAVSSYEEVVSVARRARAGLDEGKVFAGNAQHWYRLSPPLPSGQPGEQRVRAA